LSFGRKFSFHFENRRHYENLLEEFLKFSNFSKEVEILHGEKTMTYPGFKPGTVGFQVGNVTN
jgi:hypothetical protein